MIYITFYYLYDNYIGSLPMGDMEMINFEVETEEVDTKEKRYHLINKINEIRRTNE